MYFILRKFAAFVIYIIFGLISLHLKKIVIINILITKYFTFLINEF
jgi:hypothetical protein